MSASPVIAFENLSFRYDDRPVLEEVTLTVAPGEFVSVIGPNGGGKTTLLKLILGLLRPQQGRLRVFGLSPARARPRIGYMPQYAHHDPQFPTTPMEVVLMGRLRGRVFGPYLGTDRKRALEALDEVGMADRSKHPFSTLSGGQRQRVLIARALVSDPELLLMDEPTSHIDITAENDFFDLLKKLNERLTILIVSHDIGFVSTRVKSVVCVNRRVVVHPTSGLTGEAIRELYDRDVCVVRHDHRCGEEGHEWPSS